MINYLEKKGADGFKVHFLHLQEQPARKRIGANPEGESGPGGPPSDRRERVRCGEQKKGTGSTRALGTKKWRSKTSIFPSTQKDPCFRTRLIEELDVLCRLAAKYKR